MPIAPELEVSDRYLRRYVCRVQHPGGSGSGVLVAPGWMLTCAHVVGDAEQVDVVPDRRAGHGQDAPAVLTGHVRATSGLPPAGGGSAFWPFPDLALVELDGWTQHLVAPLVLAEPSRATEPHAWGFGRREESTAGPGGPASFRYVGEDGDGFLSLKAGEAPPGLSGGPLVCPTRRGVVGLMSVTRAVDDDRGGWAAPISALLGADEVPDELVRVAAPLVAANLADQWRHRDEWARVLPVSGAHDTVVRQWTESASRSSYGPEVTPSVMLRAELGLVPYRGEESLLRAEEWCRGPDPMAVSYVDAPGGAGKTRFAIELCRRMESSGWLAGSLPRTGRAVSDVPLPRLLVVDYVEERNAPDLAVQLEVLGQRATPLAPVRVLMLCRPTHGRRGGSAVQVIRELGSESEVANAALESAADRPDVAGRLGIAERRALHEDAVTAFGRWWHGPEWTPTREAPALDDDVYGRPLDVVVAAFDLVLDGHVDTDRAPLDRALDHEERHWRRRVPDLEVEDLRRVVALATLAGARDAAEATALLDLVPVLSTADASTRSRVDAWLRGLYEGEDRWNAFRPDRLGEAMILRSLADDGDGGLGLLERVLSLRSDDQVARALDVLVRLREPAPRAVTDPLAIASTRLVDRASDQAGGGVGEAGRTDLLGALLRVHAAVADAQVWGDDAVALKKVTTVLSRLGRLAEDHGSASAAAEVHAGVLQIVRSMYQANPDDSSCQYALATCLADAGSQAATAGRSAAAERLFDEALVRWRGLLAVQPGNGSYLYGAAVVLDRMSDLAAASRQAADAEGRSREALEMAREAVSANPGTPLFQSGLAVSMSKVGGFEGSAGRTAAASRLLGESLTIRRALLASEPSNAAYQGWVASSLISLGDLALGSGQQASARELFEEALRMDEQLATASPGNTVHRRSVAVLYERLAELAVGTERRQLVESALEIRRALLASEPEREDLAIEFGNTCILALMRTESTTDPESLLQELVDVLIDFQRSGALRPRGTELLAFAHRHLDA